MNPHPPTVVVRVKRKRAEETSGVLVLGGTGGDATPHTKKAREEPPSLVFCRVATLPVDTDTAKTTRASQHPRRMTDAAQRAALERTEMRDQYQRDVRDARQVNFQFVRATRMPFGFDDDEGEVTVVDAEVADEEVVSIRDLARSFRTELVCNEQPLVPVIPDDDDEDDGDYVFDIYRLMHSPADEGAPWLVLPPDRTGLVFDGAWGDEEEEGDYEVDSNAEDNPANDYPDEEDSGSGDDYDDELQEW